MAQCETCGNEYDGAFSVSMPGDDRVLIFDSFECAIHALAPRCAHCGCTVMGHGVQASAAIYCCANCAKQSGVAGVADRASA